MEELVYCGPRQLEWREAGDPKLSGDRAAIVRPLAVATCDIDALIVAGLSPYAPPFPLGHECVAEVVDAGDSAGLLGVGQRVIVPFQISCGKCVACSRGRTGNCRNVPRLATYGFGPAVDRYRGFLADRTLVPFADHMLVPVPEGLESAVVASAADNIPDGWRAAAGALTAEPGAQVLVVGGSAPGSIGLYAVAAGVALGAEKVVYVDDDNERCAVAAALGAEVIEGEYPERLGPFPITIDHSGRSEGLSLALRSTGPDGHCRSTAIYFGDPPPPLPLLRMYTLVTTFETGRVHARPAIPQVLQAIEGGVLEPQKVTTRTVEWHDAPDALAELDWIKLVIERPPASS